jgi:succinate-semialdehyde dehydrogenase/glutarate-semialdehyde dehydrogenase
MGSLISHQQLETVRHHVDDAVAKGATVLTGGRARPDIGPHFYEPTILAGVREGMAAFEDETFGPVVSLYRVESEEEAIAKGQRQPLRPELQRVDRRREARAGRVAARLQAGTSTSTRPTPRPGARSTRRWAA